MGQLNHSTGVSIALVIALISGLVYAGSYVRDTARDEAQLQVRPLAERLAHIERKLDIILWKYNIDPKLVEQRLLQDRE